MQATSFGKVILSGEHAAVYGEPAVAASVNLEIAAQLQMGVEQSPFLQNLFVLFQKKYQKQTTQFSVDLTGDLPIGSGLGSSAAIAHAVFRALAAYFQINISDDDMIALIQESERFAHGHPSGLDAATVVKKGVIQFQRHGEKFQVTPLPTTILQDKIFFLIQSGRPAESTKKMIEVVRSKQNARAIKEIGQITRQVIKNFENNHFDMAWVPANEKYLEELGVVGQKAQEMIDELEHMGAVAKVTGGGGYQHGSGMILTYHDDYEKLENFLRNKTWQYFMVHLGGK